MSNIERCWITPGEFGGTKVLHDEAHADAWRKAGFNVTGPWVLEARQPQGAVDAIRNVRRAALVGLTANDQTARLYKGALARVVEITDDALKGQ